MISYYYQIHLVVWVGGLIFKVSYKALSNHAITELAAYTKANTG